MDLFKMDFSFKINDQITDAVTQLVSKNISCEFIEFNFKLLKDEIEEHKISDILSIRYFYDKYLYDDVVNKYNDQNDYRLPSPREFQFATIPIENTQFLTNEALNDDSIVVCNLLLGSALNVGKRKQKYSLVLFKITQN
jgi:hypothetical protein